MIRHPHRIARSVAAALLLIAGGSASAVTLEMYAATSANQLVRFASDSPEIAIITAVTGLGAGENIIGIDFRPLDQRLYVLTRTAASTAALYSLDPVSAVATLAVAAPGVTLNGTKFGVDFNPTVDRLRVVSDVGQNIRINPLTGSLAGTDTPLNPGTPLVVAVAYDNAYAGSTSTTLRYIDSNTDEMLIAVISPNAGVLAPIGALGFDTADAVGFDIAAYGKSNVAYAALRVGGITGLYTVVLETGTAGYVGAIGGNPAIVGLAIRPDVIFRNGFE